MCACRAAHVVSVWASLALLVLLARAGGALQGSDLQPDTSCARLDNFTNSLAARSVRARGTARCVLLYWGSEPARAAAALLRAQLRAALRYNCVRLYKSPHRLADLRDNITFRPDGNYINLVVGLSIAWDTDDMTPAWKPLEGKDSGLAGPRLREFGRSPVPAHCRLHARLSRNASDLAACRQHQRWRFYANTSALALCDFVDEDSTTTVRSVEGCDVAAERLAARAEAAALPLHVHTVPRHELLALLRSDSRSVLFLDFDMWADDSTMTFVEPPPCENVSHTCRQELDTAVAMRVADVQMLEIYAPEFFRFIHDFKPPHTALRMILEQNGNINGSIEEAACHWALNNTQEWISNFQDYNTFSYWMAVYICKDDPDWKAYGNISGIVGYSVFESTTIPANYSIVTREYFYDCSDADSLSKEILNRLKVKDVYGLMGVVAYGGSGAAQAANAARVLGVPLVLLDAPPRALPALAAAGSVPHLATALRRFVRDAGWRRLAVLSQPTALAQHYHDALLNDTKLVLGQYDILPLNPADLNADVIMQKLQESNARIVFVNTEVETAVAILAAARAHEMSYENGYVWIIRDYRIVTRAARSTYFTVSFWGRDACDAPEPRRRWPRLALQQRLHAAWGAPGRCPPYTGALCDALLSLLHSFHDLFLQNPDLRLDLHTQEVMRLLNENFAKSPAIGLNRSLYYKDRSVEETFVYVDQWRNGTYYRRAKWRVNTTAATRLYWRGDLPHDDGERSCLARYGDAFHPTCYDGWWITLLVLLALAPPTALLARHTLRRRLARLVNLREIERLARRQHVATVLASYLVSHEALELRQQLGAGRFGSVRLALLRATPKAPRYVAAKALRDNAAASEESEFLREACTIASLDHKHVVRLVGVCIDGGPPLVLMELAFFGDLLGYLRVRRHLAEAGTEPGEHAAECEEAAHVSGEALTRLAREAASALAYLSSRGVVHRDVRAANCLVDARRSLKLADFGMARETVASTDGAPEYACRRRGLFPVLWMAPESLAHGVFSSASDVWALGVLVLELVTMGARPYGSMSPLHVLEYVAAGGRPPLPLDATPQTRGLTRLCWERAAERRPSAAEVAAYLAERPRALRPALLSAREEPPDADSGFGESPSTELLPPDSPTDMLEQLDVLAVTR